MGATTLISLAQALVVGRLCLSALSPGWPGNHDSREGGAVLCGSWMLGTAAVAFAPWIWLWGPLLLLRLALLPGGLRPRYETERRPGYLWWASATLCLGSGFLGPAWFWLAQAMCAALFVGYGLRHWRMRADRRAKLLGGLALLAPLITFLCTR
ncbi:MAG: hypothetical protein ACI9F9_002325 [Candidatus Paceibacteria bacterium]|jgi:hypothetical protein